MDDEPFLVVPTCACARHDFHCQHHYQTGAREWRCHRVDDCEGEFGREDSPLDARVRALALSQAATISLHESTSRIAGTITCAAAITRIPLNSQDSPSEANARLRREPFRTQTTFMKKRYTQR